MGSFFNSEIVREQLKEINELQSDIYGNAFAVNISSPESLKEHIEKLETLLEKQRLMYTRLSLSDDPEAKKMKEHLVKSITMLGFPEGTDMNMLFTGMKNTIASYRQRID
tara:strand:+ start:358 stop:687 length:330 start_codon:yes stop_codon:yes gene_type:complete